MKHLKYINKILTLTIILVNLIASSLLDLNKHYENDEFNAFYQDVEEIKIAKQIFKEFNMYRKYKKLL